MIKNQNVSNIIANEIYRKYNLELKKNIVIGEIESLLKKHPSLNNNISFTSGLLSLNDARAVLSILLNEIKQLNKGWKKRYKKEYWYFIQNNKQSNFKSVVFLLFIFLLIRHDNKLKQIKKTKTLKIKRMIEIDISDFVIKKNKKSMIVKNKTTRKNNLI